MLPADIAPQLVRDLIFGVLNAVSLAGTSPERAAGAVCTLLRLPAH